MPVASSYQFPSASMFLRHEEARWRHMLSGFWVCSGWLTFCYSIRVSGMPLFLLLSLFVFLFPLSSCYPRLLDFLGIRTYLRSRYSCLQSVVLNILSFCHRNTMILTFPTFTISLVCSATALIFSSYFCRDLWSSFIRSMPSANLRLFTNVPPSLIPQLLSFVWSITRSRYVMNSRGDSGSPCRVPRSAWNHSPWFFPIRTAD